MLKVFMTQSVSQIQHSVKSWRDLAPRHGFPFNIGSADGTARMVHDDAAEIMRVM